MKRLGIILCEVFEEEMLHLLQINEVFDKIIIVDNESSKYFQHGLEKNFRRKKLKLQGNYAQSVF
ncbi:MAG: hypothetical protein KO464_10895 [Candidatus Methanofastidiosum sp.]|nr:hypothetical protein [Methanofastidiosum sp.]